VRQGAVSNYRVRQVLALGAMPERQLRFLVALATWMTDDTRTVRVSVETLMHDARQARNTARTARRELEAAGKLASQPGGRGPKDVTLWTVLCLPEKGVKSADPHTGTERVSDLNPVNEVDPLKDAKGVNDDGIRGSSTPEKGGQVKSADLRKPDPLLNRSANPSVSPRAHAAILAAVPDATETEIELVAKEIDAEHAPGNLGAYIAGFPAAQIADRLTAIRDRHRGPGTSATVASLQRGAECDHGVPGGASPHPTSGEPLCPICRTASVRRPA
jgi:hypothetical protein